MICSENYRDESYGYGCREMFDEYRTLHKEFHIDREKFTDGLHEQEIKKKYQEQCAEKRENAQESVFGVCSEGKQGRGTIQW